MLSLKRLGINVEKFYGFICHLSYIKALLFHLLILGPPLPKGMQGTSTLEIQGDVYVIGGFKGEPKSAIYKLTCSSGICSWSTLNQTLKVRRSYSVAIPVPDYFCI